MNAGNHVIYPLVFKDILKIYQRGQQSKPNGI